MFVVNLNQERHRHGGDGGGDRHRGARAVGGGRSGGGSRSGGALTERSRVSGVACAVVKLVGALRRAGVVRARFNACMARSIEASVVARLDNRAESCDVVRGASRGGDRGGSLRTRGARVQGVNPGGTGACRVDEHVVGRCFGAHEIPHAGFSVGRTECESAASGVGSKARRARRARSRDLRGRIGERVFGTLSHSRVRAGGDGTRVAWLDDGALGGGVVTGASRSEDRGGSLGTLRARVHGESAGGTCARGGDERIVRRRGGTVRESLGATLASGRASDGSEARWARRAAGSCIVTVQQIHRRTIVSNIALACFACGEHCVTSVTTSCSGGTSRDSGCRTTSCNSRRMGTVEWAPLDVRMRRGSGTGCTVVVIGDSCAPGGGLSDTGRGHVRSDSFRTHRTRVHDVAGGRSRVSSFHEGTGANRACLGDWFEALRNVFRTGGESGESEAAWARGDSRMRGRRVTGGTVVVRGDAFAERVRPSSRDDSRGRTSRTSVTVRLTDSRVRVRCARNRQGGVDAGQAHDGAQSARGQDASARGAASSDLNTLHGVSIRMKTRTNVHCRVYSIRRRRRRGRTRASQSDASCTPRHRCELFASSPQSTSHEPSTEKQGHLRHAPEFPEKPSRKEGQNIESRTARIFVFRKRRRRAVDGPKRRGFRDDTLNDARKH